MGKISKANSGGLSKMRVALVHDDLVQWGGAERVLEGLCEIYPDAPIFTSVFDYSNNQLRKRFGDKKIITSFLQKIPGWKSLYKILLPLYPIAFEQFNFDDFDLVISHTTRFAKAIITKPQTKHISFVHTPPRFLWHFSSQGDYGIAEILMSKLRIYDQVSSNRVDLFIAGSKNSQRRIKKIYKRDSKLVYPFVDLERFKDIDSFDGGYFLVIARMNGYKKIELAQKACYQIDTPLRIISGGIDDEMVVNLLSGCRALIIPGIEDFGLVSLEAQAMGKPVIAFKEGGALETVIEGKTGLFFEESTVSSLIGAIEGLNHIKPEDCKENALKFSKERFKENFKQTIDKMLYTN